MLLENVPVKEFLKSVNIWLRCVLKYGVCVFSDSLFSSLRIIQATSGCIYIPQIRLRFNFLILALYKSTYLLTYLLSTNHSFMQENNHIILLSKNIFHLSSCTSIV